MTSTNWAGNYEYGAPSLSAPSSIGELQEVVAAASKIKALGSRHSFNDVADTSGEQVSLAALPRSMDLDEGARTVTVSAGTRYGEFVEQLNDAGWAIHNLASLPHISVAGAIATGTHGSGDRLGILSSVVTGLELVTATGELRRIVRGDDDLEGMVVSLGALGVTTAVTLEIEPTFEVRQDVFENLGWRELYENFDAITSSAYSVSIFTRWGESGAINVWLKSRMDGDTAAAERPTMFGATKQKVELHPLPDGPSENATKQRGVPGPWWDRLAHFRLGFTPSDGDEVQTEYLVSREHSIEAIDAIRALAPHITPHLLVSEIRTMAGDDLWLSPTYGRDSVAIHFTWKLVEEVYGLLPSIDAALAPFDARPHWGKVFETDASRLDLLYPRLGDFRELAARLDPRGKFRNSYLDRTVFAAPSYEPA